MKQSQKIAVGAGLGVLAGVAYFLWSKPAAAATPEEPPEEPPEDPAIKGAGGGATKVGGRVPAKVGTQKWNMALFPNPDVVRASLAGLSPKYAHASQGPQEMPAAVAQFQMDWNDLSKLGALDPARLNGTQLTEDALPGGQTLRALEWAMGMGWPARLAETGLGA
jgi:hypothetical protein